MATHTQRRVRGTLASECAKIRIPNWFSLSGSRTSIQKIRGAITPQDHHWAREPSSARLQLLEEKAGEANSTPRVLHIRIAPIQWTHRFLIPKLYSTGKNAVQDLVVDSRLGFSAGKRQG